MDDITSKLNNAVARAEISEKKIDHIDGKLFVLEGIANDNNIGGNGLVNSEPTALQCILEFKERQSKKKNFILFCVREQDVMSVVTSETSVDNNCTQSIRCLKPPFKAIDILNKIKVLRLGSYKQGKYAVKPRPIKIICTSEEVSGTVRHVFLKAKADPTYKTTLKKIYYLPTKRNYT